MIHYLRAYIKGCHTCQVHRNEKPQSRQLHHRINSKCTAMTRLSMYLKVMSHSYKVHKFGLVVIDEVTNFIVTNPHPSVKVRGDRHCMIEHVFSKYSIPTCMSMDQASAFMYTLINYIFMKLDIKSKAVASYNHHSLQAGHGMKSLAMILTKHLTGLGQYWPKYLPVAM